MLRIQKRALSKNFFTNFMISYFVLLYIECKMQILLKILPKKHFLEYGKKRESLQPKKSFFSLLARISTNLCYDHFRYTEVRLRNKDRIPEYGKSHFDNPEEVVQAQAIEKIIRKLVNEKLPQRCRIIFILSRIEGLSNQEISLKLGLSIRTVENQIYRALKILKKYMQKYL